MVHFSYIKTIFVVSRRKIVGFNFAEIRLVFALALLLSGALLLRAAKTAVLFVYEQCFDACRSSWRLVNNGRHIFALLCQSSKRGFFAQQQPRFLMTPQRPLRS